MSNKTSLAFSLLLLCCGALSGGDLSLNVANKDFVDDSTGACFKLYDGNKSSFILQLPSKPAVIFDSFIGLKFSEKRTSLESDPKTLSLTASQSCEGAATFNEVFTSFNGGILVSANLIGDARREENGRNLSFLIRFPSQLCAGRVMAKNGEKIQLPEEKGSYSLCKGVLNDELRIPLSDDLELGLKFLSGVKAYDLMDARHHKTPEKNFFIVVNGDGSSLKYFFCLLKPGQPFPSTSEKMVAAGKRCNLLGEGSDFEVGAKSFVVSTSASYLAEKPATQLLFDDKTAHQGRFSLKLTSPDISKNTPLEQVVQRTRENNVVWFCPLKLDPDKNYVLSAWMKAEAEGTKVTMSCSEQGNGFCGFWGKGAFNAVTVGKEWKRYVTKFKADKPLELNYRNVQFMLHGDKPGSVWIDEVQLEEGENISDYMPTPLEFGVAIDQPYKLFTADEVHNSNIKLLFRNNGAESAKCEISYSVKDYWDKPVLSGKVSKEIAANGNESAAVGLPKLPCGYYRATFDSADGKLHDEAIFGVYSPVPVDSFLPADWPLAFQAEGCVVNPLARSLGFGWVRAWQFRFANVCPEKDKLDFAKQDLYVDRCEKAKLNLMPILGVALGKNSIPEWAVESGRKSSIPHSWAGDVRFPSMDAWKFYVTTMVERYKGRVRAFELFNEPNCWITADEYLPYLKGTYEAAKAANPDSLVVGGSTTSDMGNEPAPWTTRLIDLGGLKYMDILSVHMYSGTMPEISLKGGTDKFLAMLHERMKAAGKDMPIWHTEKTHTTSVHGYSKAKSRIPEAFPHCDGYGFKVADFRAKAEFLLRESIIDSAVGKGPFFWFEDLMDRSLTPRVYLDDFGHIEYDGSPCPELLAANGLARVLQGRNTPKELLKLGTSKYCALFEGPKGVTVALWDKDGSSKIKLPKSAGDFTVCNFFGVNVESKDWIELGSSPSYLLFDGRKTADVKALLLASDGDGAKFALSGGMALEKGNLSFDSYLLNKTWRKLDAEVKLKEFPSGWSFANQSAKVAVEPESYAKGAFGVSTLKASSEPQNFTITVGQEQATIAIPPFKSEDNLKAALSDSTEATAFEVEKGKIKIDGDLSDWSDEGLCGAVTSAKVKRGRDFWKGPMDLSVEARFRWDAENLYVAYVVYDDVIERHASANAAYASDCVEMFLSFDPEAKEHFSKRNNTLTPADFQLLFAPGMGSGTFKDASAWCCQLKGEAGMKIVSKRSKYGYIMEASIPWKSFSFTPARGTVLGMTFQASDTDRKGVSAEETVYWAGEWSNCITPRNWGKLKLQ